ncbi:hypothetical protein CXF74_20775 [Psychromonas sp. Urea-02u-13]|nr:hypothetical protein CXF74_20775 [Psychromonas sp. Urea-02u-13]
MIQFRHSILPLFAVNMKNGIPKKAQDNTRYLGVAFHFNDIGNIATCAHVVNALQEGETLMAVEMHGECLAFEVKDVKCHPKYDFAVAWVGRENYEAIALHGKKDLFIGTDVMAYGFTNGGLVDGRLETVPRLFKGHIVRTYPESILPDARSTCELSFPALKGFSGTPLLFSGPDVAVAGMVFSNFESTIELFRFTEIDDANEKFSEQVHKVLELGVAHSAYDMRVFLNDLGVTRIAVSDEFPAPLET